MNTKEYNIEGVVTCKLKYLSDPNLIGKISTSSLENVLRAECIPSRNIRHGQASEYLGKENEKLILDELKNIEKENESFYTHFDIDYKNYRVGPTWGRDGLAKVFDLKPKISLKKD